MAASGAAIASTRSTTTEMSANTVSSVATTVVTTSTPGPALADPGAGGPSVPSWRRGTTRSHVDFSSRSLKQARAVSRSQPPRLRSSTRTSSGTSRTRGISKRLARTRSSASARLARSFGVSESRLA